MGGTSSQPTGTGDEHKPKLQPLPKPEELRKAQPTPSANVVRISNPGADLNKIVLDAVNSTPSMRAIRQSVGELSRMLPDILGQHSLGSPPATTTTTTVNPSQSIRYPALEVEEGQSRRIEELNNRTNKALEEVKRLREDVATDREDARKQSAAATDEVKKLVAGATEDVSGLKTDIKSLRAELEKSQLKLIETLGLFVAIFGFIIVSSSAFKDIQNANVLAGMLMISAGLIMTFVIVLDLLVRRWHYELSIDEVGWKKTLMRWVVPQGIVLLFVFGLSFWGVQLLSKGNQEIQDAAKPAVTVSPTPSTSPTPTPLPTSTQTPKG